VDPRSRHRRSGNASMVASVGSSQMPSLQDQARHPARLRSPAEGHALKCDRVAPLRCSLLASLFKTKLHLEAENGVLRHQLIVVRRRVASGHEH
jgi:hypothetical protein